MVAHLSKLHDSVKQGLLACLRLRLVILPQDAVLLDVGVGSFLPCRQVNLDDEFNLVGELFLDFTLDTS